MTDPKADSAAEAVGRIAGATVNAFGMRLLRLRMVRQALVNAGQGARGEVQPHSPPLAEGPPREAEGGGGTAEADTETER